MNKKFGKCKKINNKNYQSALYSMAMLQNEVKLGSPFVCFFTYWKSLNPCESVQKYTCFDVCHVPDMKITSDVQK